MTVNTPATWKVLALLAGLCVLTHARAADFTTREDAEAALQALEGQIAATPGRAGLYVERGKVLFHLHEFQLAIDDLSRAIQLDAGLDEAYFWRGMARGRAGEIEEGIADLGVYLDRNPDDSHALTKRGVRHIWNGDLDRAERDLRRAVAIDNTNAEAHDDLGVVLAQQGKHAEAIEHFQAATLHDPGYQKAHHNLAMTLYLEDRLTAARQAVDRALALSPDNRNSVLLKAVILEASGDVKAAARLREDAEFLPEGNWSERMPLR
jgi:tetratricopeptide (TPR) repeat protein